MYDVLYFSSNLLVTLMSTQLYVGSPTLLSTVADELKLPNPDTYNGPFSHNQPFLNYIYQLFDESEATASAGNNTLSAKLFLSSLLIHITSKPSMNSSSLSAAMIGKYHHRESSVSAAATRLEAVVTALSADGDLSANSADGEGEPAWALNEIFTTLGMI